MRWLGCLVRMHTFPAARTTCWHYDPLLYHGHKQMLSVAGCTLVHHLAGTASSLDFTIVG